MKRLTIKRMLAVFLALAVALSFTFVVPTVSAADAYGDDSSLAVTEDGEVILSLYLNSSRPTYGGTDDPYSSGSASNYYIKGRSFALTNAALNAYNAENPDSQKTLTDITAIKVITPDGVYVTRHFIDFVKEKLPHIKLLDLKNANISMDTVAPIDADLNFIDSRYFGVATDGTSPALTQIEEIILPDTLETTGFGIFAGLTTLKKVAFGDSIKTIGGCQFRNCSLDEISYHGSADATVFASLAASINESLAVVKGVDLSGSSVDVANALSIANKSTIEYINLKDCPNIEFESADGQKLLTKLVALKTEGKKVVLSDNFIITDESKVTVTEDNTSLKLSFSATRYARQGDDPYTDKYDVRGVSLSLANSAISIYNAENPDNQISLENITELKVVTAKDAFLAPAFITFVKEKLPQIKILDLKDANLTEKGLSADSNGNNNAVGNRYFGVAADTDSPLLNKIEKIILPDSLEILNFGAFAGLATLKSVEFGSSITTLGTAIFRGCSSLEAVSYHGSVDDVLTNLIGQIVESSATAVDLSGSCINADNALTIANQTDITALNLRDCENIDWSSETGTTLYTRILTLKENGADIKISGVEGKDKVIGNVVSFNNGRTAEIIVDGDTVELELYLVYGNSNVNAQIATEAALERYNFNHGTNLAMTDITKLTVATSETGYLDYTFPNYLKNNIYNVVEIDMGEANVSTSGTMNNTYQQVYFGTTDDNAVSPLPKLKKVIMSKTATTINQNAFRNLSSLEEVVLPEALKDISGFGNFIKCPSLKTITVTNADFKSISFRDTNLKNIIFVGDAEDTLEIVDTNQSNITVYCASKEVYNAAIGSNLSAAVTKKVYLGDMADVTVSTTETYDGYMLPSSKSKSFAGWEKLSDTELNALWKNGTDVLGDANADGKVDIKDLVHLKKYTAHIIEFINNNVNKIDLDNDGVIAAEELIVMRKALTGIESHEEYLERITADN